MEVRLKFLITGGAGFIGSHLAEALLAEGHSVAIIDDLSTGSMANIEHLLSNSNFTHTIDTMIRPQLLTDLVGAADAVFHLAAAVGVKLIVASPVRTIQTNIRCTELLLDIAEKTKTKVLVTSTSEVYGKSTDVPFREDGDLVLGATTRGRWSYACSKAIDEFLAIAYWREKQLPTVVARLFNTVGPRQTGRYGMVVPSLVGQALRNEPMTVFGDGRQSRCFAHVKDVVRALIALISHDDAVGEVFNVGSSEEISIMELAERIREKTRSSSEIVLVPYGQAYAENFEDMPRRVPSIEKIRKSINWSTEIDLDGILDSIIVFERARVAMSTSLDGIPAR